MYKIDITKYWGYKDKNVALLINICDKINEIVEELNKKGSNPVRDGKKSDNFYFCTECRKFWNKSGLVFNQDIPPFTTFCTKLCPDCVMEVDDSKLHFGTDGSDISLVEIIAAAEDVPGPEEKEKIKFDIRRHLHIILTGTDYNLISKLLEKL